MLTQVGVPSLIHQSKNTHRVRDSVTLTAVEPQDYIIRLSYHIWNTTLAILTVTPEDVPKSKEHKARTGSLLVRYAVHVFMMFMC